MEKYFEAKQRLTKEMLDQSSKKDLHAIINGDDSYGKKLLVSSKATKWLYGRSQADLSYHIDHMDFTLTLFTVKTPRGAIQVSLPMSGEHNVQNAVAAMGVGLSANLSLETCAVALKKFTGVPGRLQSVPNEKSVAVFVDYAHTPDALENVLIALHKIRQNIKSQGKIWTIFGCGGDRDKGKRPMMAAIAEKYSDFTVVTSDNPRTEQPQIIIDDILKGFNHSDKVLSFVDRRIAINHVISQAKQGDVILIAGKGHEDYQILGTTKHHFSDFEEAEEALKGRS
jgi:UDP-N-acetylmuramoyl-L-alanyl-D-glutamate--2,6-diaminopimelate ligase